MLTSKKVINAINEPAFAEAMAWQAHRELIRLHLRNPR